MRGVASRQWERERDSIQGRAVKQYSVFVVLKEVEYDWLGIYDMQE